MQNSVQEMKSSDQENFDFVDMSDDGNTRSKRSATTCTESTVADESQSNGDDFGTFEGPEKTMEVVFRSGKGIADGLRTLSRKQIDFLCEKAKCSILTSVSNNHMDAYVLSESSLFVYRHKLIMKTCGTTTLLRCLSSLLEFADAIGMELTWVGYSRKNLLFPSAQLWPHSNFGDEIHYIKTHEKLQSRLNGSGHILGPITGDHWFVYVADHSPSTPSEELRPCEDEVSVDVKECQEPSNERTINLMMFDMPEEVCNVFFQKNCATGKEMTLKSGIMNLCPGAQIDETAFEPCGYSMNAILHDTYSTIHVTPQAECSYASFETNTCVSNYLPLVRNALIVFRPKRFVMTMFGDTFGLDSLSSLPTDARSICLPGLGNYSRTSMSSTKVDMDLGCLMACYTFDSEPKRLTLSNSHGSKLSLGYIANSGTKESIGGNGNRERGHTVV
jgi:S-adenosylmethionine decarboxylase